MRVLGIDPGTHRTGWGVAEEHGNRLRHLGSGTIRTVASAPLAERLHQIHRALTDVIAAQAPSVMAVEDIFFAKHPNAALKLGHARGVALLIAAQTGIEVFEYPPAVVKQTIVGRGQASKDQMARLIAALFGLQGTPEPDAADALAAAVTHLRAAHAQAAIARALPIRR